MSEKVQKRLSFLINAAYGAAVVALVYLSLKYFLGWLLPFILAFCIVTVVNPLARFIKKNLVIKQETVSLIVITILYAVVAALIFLIVMQLFILAKGGLARLPAYYSQTILPSLTRAGASFTKYIGDLPPEWKQQLLGLQSEVMRESQSFLVSLSQRGITWLSTATTRIPSFLIGFVFTIMLSFFIGMQYDKVVSFIRRQLPQRANNILHELNTLVFSTVFKYIKASLTIMTITFTELAIGLSLLRTPNSIAIAAGIAVFDALPFFGTGAILAPWAVIELLQGNYTFAFGLVMLYAIVLVVRNIIEPKIVGDKLGLNPIVSLSAIYLGFRVFGVLGMIAMPMLTQITLTLHRKGTIHIFRDDPHGKPEAPAEVSGPK